MSLLRLLYGVHWSPVDACVSGKRCFHIYCVGDWEDRNLLCHERIKRSGGVGSGPIVLIQWLQGCSKLDSRPDGPAAHSQ